MTMSSSVSKVTLNGDGVQTSWPFSFKVWKAADLEVSITNAEGVTTVVSNWSVELAGVGGTVTYPTSGPILPSGSKITIARSMDFLQDVDMVSGTRWDPEVVETALDQATAERQQLKEKLERAVVVDIADSTTPAALRDAIFEARDTAVDNAASALDSAERAEIAATTVAYYNHEGTLLNGEDTITLPWAYDIQVGVDVFLAGVKQAESSLAFVDAYTVTLDTPVGADTAFEVVASAGAKGDLSKPSGAGGVGFLQQGTGAVARTVQSKLRDVVSVKDFGAVGDGVADDTAAIQAALNYGGGLFLPSGNYKISSSLTMSQRWTALIGTGFGTSIILATGGNYPALIMETDTPTSQTLLSCSLHDIGISRSSAVAITSDSVGLRMTNCQQCQISGVQVGNFFGGLLVEGGGICTFNNIFIFAGGSFGAYQAGSYGLKTISHDLGGGAYKNPAGMMINNFDIWNPFQNGYLANAIVMEACDGFWFSNGHCGFTKDNCVLVRPSITGVSSIWVIGLSFNQVHFDGASGATDYCVKYEIPVDFSGSVARHSYTGCHAGNAAVDCYNIMGAEIRDIAVSGGRVNLWSNAQYGLSVSNAQNISVNGVVISGRGSTGITGGGVLLNATLFCNIDIIADTLPVGIKLDGAATRNIVQGVFNFCPIEIDESTLTNKTNTRGAVATNQTTAIASASTITFPLGHEVMNVTGTTTINDITASFLFREITLLFNTACTVTDGNIKLAGAFTSTAGSSLTLLYNGTNWVEKSRAII